MQIHISFRSRSDLVLGADHALDFISYLAFQVCISFYSVLDKSGAWIQVGMNGDTFSIKALKECSKKFAATFKGEFLTRGNVLRIFFLFLEDFGAPL